MDFLKNDQLLCSRFPFIFCPTNIHVNITHYYYNVSIFMVQMFGYRCQLYILIHGMMESMF